MLLGGLGGGGWAALNIKHQFLATSPFFFFFFTYLQFTVPAVTSSIHPIDAHIERAKGLAWLDRIGGDAELDWTSRWMGLDVLILLLLLVLLFLFFFFHFTSRLAFCSSFLRFYIPLLRDTRGDGHGV